MTSRTATTKRCQDATPSILRHSFTPRTDLGQLCYLLAHLQVQVPGVFQRQAAVVKHAGRRGGRIFGVASRGAVRRLPACPRRHFLRAGVNPEHDASGASKTGQVPPAVIFPAWLRMFVCFFAVSVSGSSGGDGEETGARGGWSAEPFTPLAHSLTHSLSRSHADSHASAQERESGPEE